MRCSTNFMCMKKLTLFFLFFLFCGLSVFPVEKAKPKEGEGIYSFLLNNGRDPRYHFDAFVELNKNKLGKNNALLKGVTYTLPPLSVNTAANTASNTTNTAVPPKTSPSKNNVYSESLFGKKYSEYKINSNKLKGATFYLVSGHGGPDCGAVGYVDGKAIHEHEYAYDITLRLARSLMMEGATVHIIIQDKYDGIRDEQFLKNNKKETCRGKVIPRSQVKRLQQQCDEINMLSRQSKDKYQRAVFIHLDSRSKSQKLDVFFYYNRNSATGKQLARTMQTTFRERYQKFQPGRGFNGTVSPRDLYVIRNTNPITLFTELGNIQNTVDQQRFLLSDNRQALANWMCGGLITDYEKNK